MRSFAKILLPIGKKKGLTVQSSSESANSEDNEEEGPSRSSSAVPFAGAKPDIEGGDEDSEDSQDEDEDTFIVEDDAAAAELPPEFSMDTHQDLAHHFKIICQFFVHIAVLPVQERRSYMDDKMKGMSVHGW